MHARQRGVVNQIRSKDNRVWIGFRIKSGRQRTFDFTQRDRVNLDPLLTHQAQDVNIGAGLLGKTHHVKLMQGRDLLANDLRVVDPYRATKLGGQAQQIFGI